MKRAEEVMGPIQISNRECSERDALVAEIEATKTEDKGGLQYNTCTIKEHEHAPLPRIKGSYGAYE